MSIGQIVAVCAVTGAFVLFAAVLAWGDYQTRDLTPNSRKKAPQNEPGAGFLALKNAAAKAKAQDARAPSPHA